jgi:hypothetical protein
MAKHAQWTQGRMMIRETRTFADGSKKEIEAIFTESNAYGHEVGKTWESMNIVPSTRAIQPVDLLEKDMGLTACQTEGKSSQAGGTATIVSFGYLPTSYFTNASGKIWVSDATGLPVHQEYQQSGNTDPQIAVAVTLDYTYGSDVVVPTDAVAADEMRRMLSNDLWIHRATGGGMVSPGAVEMGPHK